MITADAPTRVDLAGGTLDIWPVCHLLSRPALTVNVAIDLRARVAVEERSDGVVEIVSEDRGETVRLPAGARDHTRLPLATRLVDYYGAGAGVTVRMRSSAPPHSGLGGSSTLAIALGGALARLRGHKGPPGKLRRAVQTIETQVLRTPTGYQDYVAALHGGLNAITRAATGVKLAPIESGLPLLHAHLRLVDSRIEHHSGVNNWEVVKRFLDGDAEVQESCERINRTAHQMRDALARGDLRDVARALRDEWAQRRELAPVVTNMQIERLVASALGAGALAAKICGAGGGGCLAVLVDEGCEERVMAAVREVGGAPVEARPDPVGLRVVQAAPEKDP